MTVFVAGATAEPGEILTALARQGDPCAGVRFVSVSIPGVNHFDFCSLHPDASATVFFATDTFRAALESGRAGYERLGYSEIFRYLASLPRVDLALAQLPPAAAGQAVSLGLSADFLPAVLDKATLFVGEFNGAQPRPADAPVTSPERLDYAVSCERPVPLVPVPAGSAEAAEIGRLVAAEVEDGSCLQVGIGTIPNAVLAALGDKNELGCHSGMISDGIMELARAGNLTGARKEVDPGRIVTGVVLGTAALVEWAGSAPQLAIRPVSYTHDTAVIGRLGRFVSINTALEVDLAGRVNAESIGGRRVSGPGGAVDMLRGSARSRKGKSFIALPSTAQGGRISRIVASLGADTPATAAPPDVDYVVTEHGLRRIRDLPAEARAEALVGIAHPDFREPLRDDWKALKRGAGR